VLSQRNGTYWQDHRRSESIPRFLEDRLALWKYRPPWHQDAIASDDMFPPASYQYVLYGMGFMTETGGAHAPTARQQRTSVMDEVSRLTGKLERQLPAHRELLNRIREHRLPTV
ncbi:MAG: tryptophan 7-halogenase, partial [Pseudomonadota bacterium]